MYSGRVRRKGWEVFCVTDLNMPAFVTAVTFMCSGPIKPKCWQLRMIGCYCLLGHQYQAVGYCPLVLPRSSHFGTTPLQASFPLFLESWIAKWLVSLLGPGC